jgi:GNAT superfamily N-acetyltransferase
MTGQPSPLLDRFPVTPAGEAETDEALAMVRRCSARSRFHRFHGPSDGVAYTTSQLRRPGDIVLLAWDGPRCVAMAALAREGTDRADIGVLVEDVYQRRGIGRRLILGLAEEARGRGIGTIHADVLGDDPHLVRQLSRLGPARVAIAAGTYSIDVEIAPPS